MRHARAQLARESWLGAVWRAAGVALRGASRREEDRVCLPEDGHLPTAAGVRSGSIECWAASERATRLGRARWSRWRPRRGTRGTRGRSTACCPIAAQFAHHAVESRAAGECGKRCPRCGAGACSRLGSLFTGERREETASTRRHARARDAICVYPAIGISRFGTRSLTGTFSPRTC